MPINLCPLFPSSPPHFLASIGFVSSSVAAAVSVVQLVDTTGRLGNVWRRSWLLLQHLITSRNFLATAIQLSVQSQHRRFWLFIFLFPYFEWKQKFLRYQCKTVQVQLFGCVCFKLPHSSCHSVLLTNANLKKCSLSFFLAEKRRRGGRRLGRNV